MYKSAGVASWLWTLAWKRSFVSDDHAHKAFLLQSQSQERCCWKQGEHTDIRRLMETIVRKITFRKAHQVSICSLRFAAVFQLVETGCARVLVQNAEIFTLTYGSLVRQLIADLEDIPAVNKQLDEMCASLSRHASGL